MTDNGPFDLVEALAKAEALATSTPSVDEQIAVYDGITFRVALQIVSGDVKFKSAKEAIDAAKVFQRIATDLRTAEAKKLAAQAQEDAAEAIRNLTPTERQTLRSELERRALNSGKKDRE